MAIQLETECEICREITTSASIDSKEHLQSWMRGLGWIIGDRVVCPKCVDFVFTKFEELAGRKKQPSTEGGREGR